MKSVTTKNQREIYDAASCRDRNRLYPLAELCQEIRREMMWRSLRAGGAYLDLGCAEGDMLLSASSRAARIVGVDISVRQVEKARSLDFACPAEIICSDVAVFRRSESFDLITAFEVIEHLQQPQALVQVVARHLADDGTFIISTPNSNSIDRRFKRFPPVRWLTQHVGGHDWRQPWLLHVAEYTIEEMRALLTPSLRVERVVGMNVVPWLMTLSRSRLLSQALLRRLLQFGRHSPELCDDVFYIGQKRMR